MIVRGILAHTHAGNEAEGGVSVPLFQCTLPWQGTYIDIEMFLMTPPIWVAPPKSHILAVLRPFFAPYLRD
jgi:hypothetical protein